MTGAITSFACVANEVAGANARGYEDLMMFQSTFFPLI